MIACEPRASMWKGGPRVEKTRRDARILAVRIRPRPIASVPGMGLLRRTGTGTGTGTGADGLSFGSRGSLPNATERVPPRRDGVDGGPRSRAAETSDGVDAMGPLGSRSGGVVESRGFTTIDARGRAVEVDLRESGQICGRGP